MAHIGASSSTSGPLSPAPADRIAEASVGTVRGEPLAAWVRYAIGAALVLLAIVLPLFRQTGAPSWRTIWGEDGKVYFQEAHDHGVFGALFRGYEGYLQLPARVLGALSTVVPVRVLPLYFALAATVVCGLLGWFAYWASRGWIRSRPVRLGLASLIVLMPQMGWEGTANLTNTPWAFLAVTPWALLSLTDRRRDVAVRSVIVFLAATTTPLVAPFALVAAAQAWRRRTGLALVVPVAFFAGLALQAWIVTHTSSPFEESLPRSVARLLDLLNVRVFAEFLVGDKGVSTLWTDHARLVMGTAPLVVGALFVALLVGASPKRRFLACVFAGYALLSFVIPAWSRGTNHIVPTLGEMREVRAGVSLGSVQTFDGPGAAYISNGLRYSVVPVFFLASAFAILVGQRSMRAKGIARVLPALFVAHVVALTTIGFSVTNRRSATPDWSTRIARVYETQCAHAPPGTRVKVANAPYDPPYFVTLSCRELRP